MGRQKRIGLSDKPLNIRLYEPDYLEIKRLAKKLDVPDSDVHRELVAEALRTRRGKGQVALSQVPDERLTALLRGVEELMAEMKSLFAPALRDDVQTLSSRIEFLSGQIAILVNARPDSCVSWTWNCL